MVGFVPLSEYSGRKFEEKEDYKSEVHRNLHNRSNCSKCLQSDKDTTCRLKHHRLPTKALKILAKTQLAEANRLQEKFRRNAKKVDRRSGCAGGEDEARSKVGEEQEKVFESLRHSLQGRRGWEKLKSPYEGWR